jgi:hypothetical protein
MLWEIIGPNERAVDLDSGFMERAVKGFRSKSFTASLAVVPIFVGLFQRAKVIRFFDFRPYNRFEGIA